MGNINKNRILCDKCKNEINIKIEEKYLSNGIKLQFFRCCSCKTKYLIDVTDRDIRKKQIECKKWAEARKKALDIIIDGMNEEELKKLADLVDETAFNIERLEKEIKATKTILKEKYKNEL